jgi:polar amino acid transport system substrate-binding protein
MKILLSGHVQAIALDDVTLEMSSHEAGVPVSAFEPVLPIAEALQFLAFSLDTSDDVVQRCQKALDEMKADGMFARIYKRWLPAAVPP